MTANSRPGSDHETLPDSSLNFVVVVSTAPWSGVRHMAAQRFVRALVDAGHGLSMVFFREDGVYAAVAGRETDPGTPDLHAGWTELQEATETQMLVCSAAAQRRLERAPGDSFREAGLAELADAVQACDRVVTF